MLAVAAVLGEFCCFCSCSSSLVLRPTATRAFSLCTVSSLQLLQLCSLQFQTFLFIFTASSLQFFSHTPRVLRFFSAILLECCGFSSLTPQVLRFFFPTPQVLRFFFPYSSSVAFFFALLPKCCSFFQSALLLKCCSFPQMLHLILPQF